jgi:mannonate dehydratase
MREDQMGIAVGQFSELTDEKSWFAARIGITSVPLNTPRLPGRATHLAATIKRVAA